MQSASSWIWTRVAVSISYDDNHYTTGTSKKEKEIDVRRATDIEYRTARCNIYIIYSEWVYKSMAYCDL